MPTPEEITAQHDIDPDENPFVHGKPPVETIKVVPYDPAWPALYQKLVQEIGNALGDVALKIDHVGSTAVPELAAKPVIDLDLTVADPTQENSYVPALASLGYDLIVREPSFHQHRCLRLEKPRVNLHVFGPDCSENIRHLLFRDWLREHPEDRALYVQAKYGAIGNADNVMEYNQRKQDVIREIYGRVFKAKGLI